MWMPRKHRSRGLGPRRIGDRDVYAELVAYGPGAHARLRQMLARPLALMLFASAFNNRRGNYRPLSS
jgi:hypothetical protein